ncbi:hypothetical protein [Lederbergia citrea]|uniref:hypothetical protein n=1 Tax=Lederbergia citrea TaxID=2833581 RepID=UPI001BC9ABFE|nr:hypothetical protein [Lederbergia citrea]MBS4205689.1 hypothetical protein [Lederbergia citrea]
MNSIKVVMPVVALVIVFLLGNWLFPFSMISFNKSYSYDQDNVSGREFLKEYKVAKAFAKEQETDKVSIAVLDFYHTIDHSYIIELGKQSISKQSLYSLQLALEQNRKSFMKLLADNNVDLSIDSKQSLLFAINEIESTENQLKDLQQLPLKRSDLRRSIRNTLVTLEFACELTDHFYHSYIDQR